MGRSLIRILFVLLLPVTGFGEERLGVFEFFVRGGGEYCIAAAPAVRALQTAMQGRAVLLEYPYDSFGAGRVDRFWAAYAGPSPYLPLVVVGSGFEVSQGPVDYSNRYQQMLEAELARPPRASVSAWSRRSGNGLQVWATARNTGEASLAASNRLAFWLVVWEEARIGLTNSYVRATASRAVTSDVPPGQTASVTFDVPSLVPSDWQAVRALVLLEDQPPGGNRYDMLQSAIALPPAITASPSSVVLDSASPAATVRIDGPHVLTWSATCDAPWLVVSPTFGSVPGELTIRQSGHADAGSIARVRVTATGQGMSLATEIVVTSAGSPAALRPFPQHVSYARRTIKPNHRPQTQMDDDVRAYYDAWKASYLVNAGTGGDGTPIYRVIADRTDPSHTTSIGQGYGMMIVAWMAGHDPDARAIYDGLRAFARASPSSIDQRLMSREVPPDPNRPGSAFEGDADIAYALLLADAQWGSAGAVDYRMEAGSVLDGLVTSTLGPQSHLPTLGDWVEFGGTLCNQCTPRSSDLQIDHFRAFAAATLDPRWVEAVRVSRDLVATMQATYSPGTGLLPDYIVDADFAPKPARPWFIEGPYDGCFFRNAATTSWRIGYDALVSGDTVTQAHARKLTCWAAATTSGKPSAFRPGYRLDGTPLDECGSALLLFVAPLGVAAMNDPDAQQWLNAIYDVVRTRHENSHEDSVGMLSMLVMSGNAWAPEIRLERTRPVRRGTSTR